MSDCNPPPSRLSPFTDAHMHYSALTVHRTTESSPFCGGGGGGINNLPRYHALPVKVQRKPPSKLFLRCRIIIHVRIVQGHHGPYQPNIAVKGGGYY